MKTAARASFRTRLQGYVALTKPRIIELLLITTVPTMIVAEEGLPFTAVCAIRKMFLRSRQ